MESNNIRVRYHKIIFHIKLRPDNFCQLTFTVWGHIPVDSLPEYINIIRITKNTELTQVDYINLGGCVCKSVWSWLSDNIKISYKRP